MTDLPSTGDKEPLAVKLGAALIAAAAALAIGWAAFRGYPDLWSRRWLMLTLTAPGGAVAGWLLSRSFGRPGAAGWIRAVGAGLVCVLLGGALAGVFLGLAETIGGLREEGGAEGWTALYEVARGVGLGVAMGAVFAFMILTGLGPWPLLAWAGGVLLLHLLVGVLRRRLARRGL